MVIIPGKDTLFHLLLYKASPRLSILPKKMIEEKTMYEEKKKGHTNPIPGKEGEIMNCNGNKCIECTVTQCANHCGSSNYCALDRILVGTHEGNPTMDQCTDCKSFRKK